MHPFKRIPGREGGSGRDGGSGDGRGVEATPQDSGRNFRPRRVPPLDNPSRVAGPKSRLLRAVLRGRRSFHCSCGPAAAGAAAAAAGSVPEGRCSARRRGGGGWVGGWVGGGLGGRWCRRGGRACGRSRVAGLSSGGGGSRWSLTSNREPSANPRREKIV
jgi:hypothetical protein